VLTRRWHVNIDYNITSHRPIIGTAIVFVKKIVRKLLRWLISYPFTSVEEFNQSTVSALHHLKDGLITMHQEQSEIMEKLILENELLKKKQKEMNEIHKEMVKFIGDLREELSQIKTTARISNERTRRMERLAKYPELAIAVEQQPIIQENNIQYSQRINDDSFDYFMFDEYYRGNKQKIKERQKRYIKYFKGKENVLDLGCGRGYFCELLQFQGISYLGIDNNPDMLSACQENSLNVMNSEIMDYLNRQPNQSIGGVFLGNIVDHFTPQQFYELLRLVYQKLQPGAYCVMESVNPQSIQTMQEYPFTDVLNGKLLNPRTAKFMYESAGLNLVQLDFCSSLDSGFDKLIIENEKMSDYLEKIDDLLFGDQFYSVVGLK